MSDNIPTTWQPIVTNNSEGLYIEVALTGGREQVGILDKIPIARITDLLTEVSIALSDALRKCSPNKAGLEIGIEFGIKEGQLVALIARGDTTANLKVTMEWTKE